MREAAVDQPPTVLVVSQLPGLVGSDRLRDPFMELREGLLSRNGAGGSTISGIDRVDVNTEADRLRVDAAAGLWC
ncbi:hypothetical protein [Streptomyces sp. NPDC008122]|uniref:hypothetical protein n=1 Tax=Streptomyces sp. NPDC008122 TaxID=3364810 RepID=UPI0036EDC500